MREKHDRALAHRSLRVLLTAALILGTEQCGVVDTDTPTGQTPFSVDDAEDRCLLEFADLAPQEPGAAAVYTLLHLGITTGCGQNPLRFCPEEDVTRRQASLFLLRSEHGEGYIPPPAEGLFDDVSAGHWSAPWIEQLYHEGITVGCAQDPPRFCPERAVSRRELAVLLLRTKHGSTYAPPPAEGLFDDVAESHWSAPWIEQLYREGVIGSCARNPLRVCPDRTVSRSAIAAMLVTTFELNDDVCDETGLDGGPADTGATEAGAPDAGDDDGGAADGGLVDNAPPLLQEPIAYDVVVVGAGAGGSMAAVQAARMGASVALVEETDLVGGQMSAAAVPAIDEGVIEEAIPYGIRREFVNRVKAHYQGLGKSVGTCLFSDLGVCFEPSVAREILKQMFAEADALPDGELDLYLGERVVEVRRQANRVTGLVTARGLQLESQVLVDATEHGDLLPLAGARYRVGNSTSDAVDLNTCIQDITYAAMIRKYPGAVPAALALDTKPPGYDEEAPLFARTVTRNGTAWWPRVYPVDFVFHNAYRGVPDSTTSTNYNAGSRQSAALISRTAVNWANDYPHTAAYNPVPGATVPTLPARFLEDRAFRFQESCQAKLRTLQFLYYVQHALSEPRWSVANDEGYRTTYNDQENACPNIPAAFREIERHFPVMPYVRESRRVIGLHTLKASEVNRVGTPPRARTAFQSALAVSTYAIDLHNCKAFEHLETEHDSPGDIQHVRRAPFQVPFEVFVPESVDGLLVAEKNLSVTRLVNGAIRLQGITLSTGQAVGTIAALAVQRGVQPRSLDPIAVQWALARAGGRLSLYQYDDVHPGDARWADVQLVSAHGLMRGSGRLFSPAATFTRAQVAAVLTRLLRLPRVDPDSPTFNDVDPDHWAYAVIEALAAAELTGGCADNPPRFCPDAPVSREQLAAFVVRALDLQDLPVPPTPIFDDVTDPEHWGFRPVQIAASEGLMSGCQGSSFCPTASSTRAEAAALFSLVLRRGDFYAPYRPPIITSLQVQGARTVVVRGDRFEPEAVVDLESLAGQELGWDAPTSWVDSGRVTFQLPGAVPGPRTVRVRLKNPPGFGGTSDWVDLVVP